MPTTTPTDFRRIRLYVATAAAAALVLALTYLLFVRTHWGQRVDDIAFDGRAVEDPAVTRATNDVLHRVTRSTLVLLTAAIVAFALARRRIRLALLAGAAIAAAVITTEILKLRVLERPDLDGIAGIANNSFPSGHATIGLALSLGSVMVAPHRYRWIAACAGVAVTMLFGVGVLATGWHRPSDVLGAYACCVLMFSSATAILLRWRGGGTDEMGSVEERLSGPAAAIASILISVAAIIALTLTFREDSLRSVEFAGDYVLASAGILILGAAIVIGYHQTLRGLSLDPPDEEH